MYLSAMYRLRWYRKAFLSSRSQTTVRWRKLVFIHTWLSRAYLALARPSCTFIRYNYICFVPLSIGCICLLWSRLLESNSASQVMPPYLDRSALSLPNGPCMAHKMGVRLKDIRWMAKLGNRRWTRLAGSIAVLVWALLTFGFSFQLKASLNFRWHKWFRPNVLRNFQFTFSFCQKWNFHFRSTSNRNGV